MIKEYSKKNADKIAKNFRVSEFACKGSGCCDSVLIDSGLVEILQKIRDHFGKPVRISSAYRCETWNKKVGGVSGSKHLQGMAADIKVDDTTPADVAKYAESIGVLGIGLYETDSDGHFVHVDTRTKKSFWYGQKQQRRDTFGGAVEKPVETVKKVFISVPVLKAGSNGGSVKAMQNLLICKGYSCGSKGADGWFGSATYADLRLFQHKNNLRVSGECDASTWAKLLGM